jgi:predicted AAA+ superfamily ATPase
VQAIKCGDKLPLKAYVEPSAFKLYFVDVGLFRHFAGISSEVILDKSAIFNEYNGLLAEQFVLQQLHDFDMYFWTSGVTAEVDFVTQIGSKILPIEVKSGLNVKAQSLKVYRERYKPELAIRFSLKNTKLDNNLLNISLFNIFLCEKLLKNFSEKCINTGDF